MVHPNIVLSNKRGGHKCQKSSAVCASKFDGIGGILGHSDFPRSDNSLIEIHIDSDENWYIGTDDNTPENQTNLYAVLIHEIGHALGIAHSNDRNSIMFAFYSGDKLELGNDDINAIQSLYGSPTVNNQPTTSPIKPNPLEPELCELNNVETFLIVNQIMYIFYEKWVWMISLSDMNIPKPQLITDWLLFLPPDFKNISTLYQRPSGEIVFFINNLIYMIKFPSLMLVSGYPKQISTLGITSNARIHTAVNTYTGQTFIFYNDIYYMELDECQFVAKSYGMISRKFPGVPPNMKSAFRYSNGMLYFFKDNTVFEFNEFTNTLLRAGKNNLSIFGIQCKKIPSSYGEIIVNLKKLVLKLDALNA